VSQATDLINNIFDMYESSTAPDALEQRDDLLQQASELSGSEFSNFVQWFGQERYGISGSDPHEIMQQMHPWQLSLVVQKFRKPAHSPEA
jgi:hypothetical protein